MSDQETLPITNLFPDIIIFEILTHLPSKDACRFKLVSKRSNALISHTHFVTTYLSRNPPSSWVPLDRFIVISNTSPVPTHLPLSAPPSLYVHPFTINPKLLLKPNEPIPSRQQNQYPGAILHASSGLVLFTVNILPKTKKRVGPGLFVEFRGGQGELVSGLDSTEDLLFVINPVTKQCAGLLNNPYPPGGQKMFNWNCYCLVACGTTGEFVTGMYAAFDEKPFLACYSSRTGEWVKKKVIYPAELWDWYPNSAFEFEGKMYWVDLSLGIIKWEVGDVFTAAATKKKAKFVFIPLPGGREKREGGKSRGDMMDSRYAGPTEGKWIQFMETMDKGEVGLEMWRLVGNKEWELLYKVSRLKIERGLGLAYGFDLIGWPSAHCVDPMDAEIAVLSIKETIFPLNARTQVVGTGHSYIGAPMVTPLVLPSWPTPLPPRLYAEYMKEQGNGFFNAKYFKKAIKCYSKSLALSPTAAVYANRAMSYLKISNFPEAEDDCTKALNLDSGYFKAYVRRALARKELDNLDGALEDVNHALRLEPQSEEAKRRHAEIKSLHEKASVVDG